MNYQYKVTAGDWANDGHGMSETFQFRCTHPQEEILGAYRLAVKKSGVSLRDRHYDKIKATAVCCDFEDSVIHHFEMEKLAALGINFHNGDEDSIWESAIEDDGAMSMFGQDLATLFLEMVKTQIEGFRYEFDDTKCIFNGFGYGCYSN